MGTAIMASMTRMMKASTTPPAMPAIRPSAMPMTLEMTTATIPTVKEMRAP